MTDVLSKNYQSQFYQVFGGGKNNPLNHILNNREGRKVAVIVNDMSEVNIDAGLVEKGGSNLSRTEEKLLK